MVPSKILVFVLIFGFVQFISGPRGAVKAQDDDDDTSDTKEKVMAILNGDGDKTEKMKKALAVCRDTIDAMNMVMDMMDDGGNTDATGEPTGDTTENPSTPDVAVPTVGVPTDIVSDGWGSIPPITLSDVPEVATPSQPSPLDMKNKKLPYHPANKLPVPGPTMPALNTPTIPSAPSQLGAVQDGPDPNVPDPNVPAVPSAPSPLDAAPSVPDPNVPAPSDSSPLGGVQDGPDPNAPDASVPDPNVPAVPSAPSPKGPGPNAPAPNVPNPNGARPNGGYPGKGGRRGRYGPRNAQRSTN